MSLVSLTTKMGREQAIAVLIAKTIYYHTLFSEFLFYSGFGIVICLSLQLGFFFLSFLLGRYSNSFLVLPASLTLFLH